jgi:hypothetical protein
MTAADAERLLNYALPVARFLGVRRVRLPSYRINADRPAFDSAFAEPPGMRPSPEGMWESVVRAATRLLTEELTDEERADPDNCFILDVSEPEWWVDFLAQEAVGPKHPLEPLEQPCPPEFGLGEFLKGAWYAPLGHLVLADRLEDQSGPSVVATALRCSAADPYRPGRYGEWTSHDAFGWCWLSTDVVCYVSRCCTHWQDKRPELKTVGFVVGLLYGQAGAMARRWARWVSDFEVGRRLAAEMGVCLLEHDEPSADL